MKLPILLALGLATAGCSRSGTTSTDSPAADAPANAVAADDRNAAPRGNAARVAAPVTPGKDAFLGRWIGVEGMYLDIASGTAPGTYRLTMQWDLDHHGIFVGHWTELTAASIDFVRDGKPEVLRVTDGDATGLKYLAGKKDCLTVKPGEGYCRG